MSKFIDRTGETNINNKGLKMTIVKCNGTDDIDVQFEDGAIAKHKAYCHFKIGRIAHPDMARAKHDIIHVGDSFKALNGMNYTVTNVNKCDSVTVMFEDGVVVEKLRYEQVRNGRVRHPNINLSGRHLRKSDRLGEVNKSKYGETMTIIKYNNCLDCDVRFDNGTVLKSVKYEKFKRGTLTSSEEYSKAYKRTKILGRESTSSEEYSKAYKRTKILGRESISSSGLKMKIIDYRSSTDIDIQFEDGVIVRNKCLSSFTTGCIGHPKISTRILNCSYKKIGETAINNRGLQMTIVAYRGRTDIDIQFKDGTIVENRYYHDFKVGNIRHPKYRNVQLEFECNGTKYFKVLCTKCNTWHILQDTELEDFNCMRYSEYEVQ